MDGLLLALSGKKVIGQLGLIPVKVKYGADKYDAQWACDLMVDPDYRKKGIGRLLFDEGLRRDVITLGNNPSPAAESVMMKRGFKRIESGKAMIFPINTVHLLKWAMKGKFQFAVPLLGKFVQPYFASRLKKAKKMKSSFRKCKWEDLIELISVTQGKIRNPLICHDNEFLSWRAKGIERFSPEFSAAKSENESYVLYSSFHPYLNIYDWHCGNAGDAAEMISYVFHETDEFNSEIVQLIVNDPNEEEWLSGLGFVKARNSEKIIHYSEENVLGSATKFCFTLCDADVNL